MQDSRTGTVGLFTCEYAETPVPDHDQAVVPDRLAGWSCGRRPGFWCEVRRGAGSGGPALRDESGLCHQLAPPSVRRPVCPRGQPFARHPPILRRSRWVSLRIVIRSRRGTTRSGRAPADPSQRGAVNYDMTVRHDSRWPGLAGCGCVVVPRDTKAHRSVLLGEGHAPFLDVVRGPGPSRREPPNTTKPARGPASCGCLAVRFYQAGPDVRAATRQRAEASRFGGRRSPAAKPSPPGPTTFDLAPDPFRWETSFGVKARRSSPLCFRDFA